MEWSKIPPFIFWGKLCQGRRHNLKSGGADTKYTNVFLIIGHGMHHYGNLAILLSLIGLVTSMRQKVEVCPQFKKGGLLPLLPPVYLSTVYT